MPRRNVTGLASALLAMLVAVAVPAAAQITTGTVSGTVTDAQGGTVPGATVVLVSETQGTKLAPQVTNVDGIYVFSGVASDTYTVDVTLSGFKESTRKGLKIAGGDKVNVPAVQLVPGGVTETVEVKADIPILQAASGERSDVVQTEQLQSLPIARTSGSGFREFANLLPGVSPSGSGRVGGGGEDNIMIDGISNMDTGNNGLMSGLNIPVDSVAEVRVETSGYQAEFGRSSGLQVSAVTKSGTNRFHGSLYDIENNSRWNQNSWANIQNGNAKGRSASRFWGYTIGGPVGKPGGNNKLFFFYAQGYRPTLSGGSTVTARVPTMAERAGDFSASLGQNGTSLIAALKNCAPVACPGNVIPAADLYGPGLAVLNSFPAPDAAFGTLSNNAANYTGVTPILHQLWYLPTIRGDYQVTPGLRVSAKWTGNGSRIIDAPGNFPGFSDTIQNFPWSFNTSGTVDYSLTPTTFLEVTYGMNQNRLGTPPVSQYSNRNNVTCAAEMNGTLPLGVTGNQAIGNVSNCTEAALPYPLSNNITFKPSYYETQANLTIGVPFLVNNGGTVSSVLPPTISFGSNNTFLPNSGVTAPPSIVYPGFMNINRNQNLAASITKVLARHTLKAGFYLDHSYKAQNQQSGNFNGSLNFTNDTNNPLDSGYAPANAALGIFDTYQQNSQFIEGSFLYNSYEGYLQDNWKVNRKLTLDFGMRFTNEGPQYDQFNAGSTFRLNEVNLNNAPALYQPACSSSPCSSTNRVALNPITGQKLQTGTSGLIGQAVPSTGNPSQGVVQAGTNGVATTAYTWPTLAFAPRFGGAYDVSGNQKLIVRGSVGLFYDRPDGNSVFSSVINPFPGGVTSTTDSFGTLGTLGTGIAAGPVPNVTVWQYNAQLPSDTQWNLGMQMALPWASSIGVLYVGHHSFNVPGNTQGNSAVNLNQVPLGLGLTTAGEDATASNQPLTNNLLRPIRGYGTINVQESQFHRTFHSIQTDYTRRFRNGVSFGGNWVYTISDKGTTVMPGGNPQLRLDDVINADGTVTITTDPLNSQMQALFADQGTTKQFLTLNAVWQLPSIKADSGAMKAIGYVLNDWQLSGILRLDSGSPFDVGYSYGGNLSGVTLTGSPDYTARILINNLSALGSGCSSNQYQQLTNNFVANSTVLGSGTAVQGPVAGSNALESGRNLLHACGNRTLDLSLSRTIRLGGGRQIQLRADAFNAPNAVIFNARGTTVNINTPAGQTVTNGIFNADGTVATSSVKPNATNNFGMATGAAAARTIQGQIRFIF